MTPTQWRQVKGIFQEVLDAPEDSRARVLDKACAGESSALRREVESLLAAHFESESFIEKPAFQVAAVFESERSETAAESSSETLAEKRFGHYLIVREIGAGGMGAVFLATRADGEFRQQAALKLIRQTIADSHLINRFKRERQILASLNHPNIARLLDGGVSADGLPYLVMEYVEGVPITEYTARNALSIEERLRLFLKICSGVAYAHRNLIVHRDLKPSNILVTKDGSNPVLLDFGLAKLLSENSDADPGDTATAFRAMTPAYASPEQLRGDRVTTASDIYSLGIVLYELLTGKRPFNLKRQSLDEAARVVCETEPLAPSAALEIGRRDEEKERETRSRNSQGAAEKKDEILFSSSAAKKSVSESLALSPSRLKGDLDNIILTALRREPERRYRSVEQFADDIERHLKGLPVSARPNTFRYRAEKFVKRNKVGVIAAALVFVSLLSGIAATAWQARVAAQERDRALASQERAQRISAFLQDMLKAASPEERGRDAKVIDVLNDAAHRIETEFNDQPEQKIELLLTLEYAYQSNGLLDAAFQKAQQALDLSRQNFGDEHRLTAYSQTQLGQLHLVAGNNAEAEPLLRRSLETQRKLSLADTKEYVSTEYMLGELLLRHGQLKEGEILLNAAFELGKKVLGENSLEVVQIELSLGRARQFAGDLDAGEAAYRRTSEYFRQSPRYRSRLILSLINLGNVLIRKERYDEADAVLQEADEIAGQIGTNTDYPRGILLNYRSQIQFAKKDFVKAEEFARKSVQLWEPIINRDNEDFLNVKQRLGTSLFKQGKTGEGEKVLREVWETVKQRQTNEPWRLPLIELRLGECLMMQNRLLEAEPFITAAADNLKSVWGEKNDTVQEAARHAAELYERLRRPDAAARYRPLPPPTQNTR